MSAFDSVPAYAQMAQNGKLWTIFKHAKIQNNGCHSTGYYQGYGDIGSLLERIDDDNLPIIRLDLVEINKAWEFTKLDDSLRPVETDPKWHGGTLFGFLEAVRSLEIPVEYRWCVT